MESIPVHSFRPFHSLNLIRQLQCLTIDPESFHQLVFIQMCGVQSLSATSIYSLVSSRVGPRPCLLQVPNTSVLAGAVPGNEDFRGKVSGLQRLPTGRPRPPDGCRGSAFSQSALGAYYRRLCARLDRPKPSPPPPINWPA